MGPGDLVECIRDGFEAAGFRDETVPVRGTIYTVREVVRYGSKCGFRFHEIRNSPRRYCDGFAECSFAVDNFRPVNPDRIACFRTALVSKKEGEHV